MRLCAQTIRAQALWISMEVVGGVRIVQCHAIIDVVIDVRVMQCHASMDVVIGVRVVLCHQAIDNSGFSTFLNFPLRVPILILLSCCINSSSLFPVAILCTLLHRENTSFEVWYLHVRRPCAVQSALWPFVGSSEPHQLHTARIPEIVSTTVYAASSALFVGASQ